MRLQLEVEQRSQAAAKASEDSCSASAALLQQQLDEAKAALASMEAELTQARAALSNADTAHMDAYHALQAEAMMLRTRLGELLPIEEKYKAVISENRELYNTVQDLRGNIRVFCRWVMGPGQQAHSSQLLCGHIHAQSMNRSMSQLVELVHLCLPDTLLQGANSMPGHLHVCSALTKCRSCTGSSAQSYANNPLVCRSYTL
jgi:hypothetical protein